MKVTIDEMHIERLKGLQEVCACIGYNVPEDKEIQCKPDIFWLMYHILDDAINSTGKVVREETAPEIKELKEVHKPDLKPLKRL